MLQAEGRDVYCTLKARGVLSGAALLPWWAKWRSRRGDKAQSPATHDTGQTDRLQHMIISSVYAKFHQFDQDSQKWTIRVWKKTSGNRNYDTITDM